MKIVSTILFALYVVLGLWVRFNNPELTQTQLLIEFWYVWLLGFVLIPVTTISFRK